MGAILVVFFGEGCINAGCLLMVQSGSMSMCCNPHMEKSVAADTVHVHVFFVKLLGKIVRGGCCVRGEWDKDVWGAGKG